MKQTLSDYGTVNRGVCGVDAGGHLESVVERLNISYSNGVVKCNDGLIPETLDVNTIVSMNFWCFYPSIFSYTEKLFENFLFCGSSTVDPCQSKNYELVFHNSDVEIGRAHV